MLWIKKKPNTAIHHAHHAIANAQTANAQKVAAANAGLKSVLVMTKAVSANGFCHYSEIKWHIRGLLFTSP